MKVPNLRYRRIVGRRYAIDARLVLAFLLAFMSLFFTPTFAFTDPIFWLQGKIYLVKFGVPYDKPVKLVLRCPDYWGKSPYISRKTCLNYECTIGMLDLWMFNDGACDLDVTTVDGESFTLYGSIGYMNDLDDMYFLKEIDLGTRQMREYDNFQYDVKVLETYAGIFWAALLLTVVVEAFALFFATKILLKFNHLGAKKVLLVGGLSSLLTLPCLWFVLPWVWTILGVSYISCVGIAEVLVVLVEARIYRWQLGGSFRLALLLSFIINSLSFLVGVLMF